VRVEGETRDGLVLRRARTDRLGPNLIKRSSPCISRSAGRAASSSAEGETKCFINMRNERMLGVIENVGALANFLSAQARQPVRDATGLEGSYSIEVAFDPVTLISFRNPSDSPFATYPTISEAFNDQLGLRLETERTPGRVLIVEHAELPTEN
jgi:uncharacterized protein (TIGR03435 family)